jgi:hypothetical protein
MLLTRARMLRLEQETFSRGIPADVLMEAIGAKLARFVPWLPRGTLRRSGGASWSAPRFHATTLRR